MAGGRSDEGRLDGGRLDGGEAGLLLGGLLASGGMLGGRLRGGTLLGVTLPKGGRLDATLAGALLLGGELPAGAALELASGRTLGLLVSGKRTLITWAIDSVAAWTSGCSLFTSCIRARVWLRVPRALLMQVLPSTSVDAYSASNSAPTERAMFCAMPSTSFGMFSSCCSA